MTTLHPPAARLLMLTLVSGLACAETPRRDRTIPPSAVRGNSAPLRPLAIPVARPRPDSSADGPVLIPAPPQLATADAPAPTPGTAAAVPGARPIELVKASVPQPDAGQVAVPADPLDRLRSLYQEAEARYARVDAFEARLTRREFMAGKEGPLEVIRYKFRKHPLSIHMKWIGTEGQGREVLFVDGQHEGKIHIMTARGDMFPLSPVAQLALMPDSDMVRSKSRHSIRDAGLGSSIRQLGKALAEAERNPGASRVAYRGLVERSEYHARMDAVEETIRPGVEGELPKGGRRTVYYDATPNSPTRGLPVIVTTRDHTGREVEYYCFDRFLCPIVLDDADFDPARLWKKR